MLVYLIIALAAFIVTLAFYSPGKEPCIIRITGESVSINNCPTTAEALEGYSRLQPARIW